MQNGNARDNGNGRRDKNGLTPKQRKSIPIIAAAKSKRQGIIQCTKQKIVTESHFYRRWWQEPAYVKAYNKAKEELEGQIEDRYNQLAIAEVMATARNVFKVAQSFGPNNMQAAKMHLGSVGIDTGQNLRFTSSTHIHQTNIHATFRIELENKSKDELDTMLDSELAGLNRLIDLEDFATGSNNN